MISTMQSASPAPAYAVLWGNLPAQEQAVVTLWREGGFIPAGNVQTDLARLRWFYLDNPQGIAHVNLLAYGTDKEPVGCLGVAPRTFLLNGEAAIGGTLVDFVVNPKHRSAYPALTLQRTGRDRALRTWEFVYGLPDTKAVAICKRLNMHVSFQLPRFVRVVRSRGYLARIFSPGAATILGWLVDRIDKLVVHAQLLGSGNIGTWQQGFDADFDTLWTAFNKQNICIGIRDRTFLNWRFGAQPGHKYHVFTVRRRSDNELRMYFVCEHSEHTLMVKDSLCIGSEAELRQGLLLLTLAARQMRMSAVQLQLSADSIWQRALRHARFVLRSQRPFFATFREPLQEGAVGQHWYITQADEDV